MDGIRTLATFAEILACKKTNNSLNTLRISEFTRPASNTSSASLSGPRTITLSSSVSALLEFS